jgi:hypothetical protein
MSKEKFLISEETLNLLFENLDKSKPNTIKLLREIVLEEINSSNVPEPATRPAPKQDGEKEVAAIEVVKY